MPRLPFSSCGARHNQVGQAQKPWRVPVVGGGRERLSRRTSSLELSGAARATQPALPLVAGAVEESMAERHCMCDAVC